MKVRPIKDYLLLEPEKLPERTAGGLVLPTKTVAPKTIIGKVLAAGRGRVLDSGARSEPEVRVGDRVVIMRHNMLQTFDPLGSEDGLALVPEADVIAVLEDAAAE